MYKLLKILLHQEILILRIFSNFLWLDYFTPKYHFCRLLVISYISYYELPIGKSLHRCILAYCILAYKYNNYFPISGDYCTDFTYLTPNNWKKSYNSIEDTPLPSRNRGILFGRVAAWPYNVSRKMDTTNIFPFLAIFAQNVTVIHQRITQLYNKIVFLPI